MADDAEDRLETLPATCALKSEGGAGEGTRWLSSPNDVAVVVASATFFNQPLIRLNES